MTHTKTRIVHIVPTLALGGAERIVVDLACFADRSQYDVMVVTIVDGGPLADMLHAHGVPYFSLTKKTRFGIGMLVELTRLLHRVKPDIVHTHLFGAHVWGMIAAMVNRVPVIVASEQNTDIDVSELRHRVKQGVSFFADVVIAASAAIRNFLIEREYVSSEKIVVVRNAIETDSFVSLPEPVFGASLKLLAVGRLEPQKGHDVLLDAVARLDIPWELTIVGVGSLADALVARAAQLGVEDRVKFVGAHHDISSYMRACDAVVMPSRWEGIGLVVMEGMAAGRPVIASRVGGIPELITHGENGILVEPENSRELADALQWVWQHQAEARAMGLRAREYAREHCDVRVMVKQYESVYAHLAH